VSEAPSRRWRRGRVASVRTRRRNVADRRCGGLVVPLPGAALRGTRFSTVVVDPQRTVVAPYATPDDAWRLPRTVAMRSALSRSAGRLRGQALPFASRRRSLAVGRAACSSSRTAASSPAARPSRCRFARLLEPRTRPHFAREAAAGGAGDRNRAGAHQGEILTLYLGLAPYGGNLEASRGVIGLFRQGAKSASRLAKPRCRCDPTIARSAPPGPFRRCGAPPRAGSACSTASRRQGKFPLDEVDARPLGPRLRLPRARRPMPGGFETPLRMPIQQ